MPEQEFKLLITGDASSYVGATGQAGDATNKLKIDTSDLSDETKRSLGLLDPLKENSKDLGTEVEKAGEKFGGSRRELREMGNELGRATGLAGAGRLMMGGIAVAAFAAAKSIEFLKNTWEQIQESIKGPVNIEIKDDAARISAVAKSWNEYADARAKVIAANNTPEKLAGQEVKALEDKLKLLKDILKAEEEEALANLSTKKDSMTPEAYAAAQAQIKKNFGEKETSANEQSEQDKIKIKQQEADRLEADAAAKKKAADAISTGDSPKDQEAIAIAKKNAEDAKSKLAALDDKMQRNQRLGEYWKGGSPVDYEGLGGKAKLLGEAKDFWNDYGYGKDTTSANAIEQQRKAQLEASIRSGAFVEQDQKTRTEKKGKLLTEAGDESGQASNLRDEIKQMMAEAIRQALTDEGTSALKNAGGALAREGAAENNNTPAGTADAVAALRGGQQAGQQVEATLVHVGNSNKELHAALEKALADIAAENKKLAAKIAQMPFQNK